MLFLSGAPAAAHQPWFNRDGSPDPDRPFALPAPPAVSQVIYGGLQGPGRVDFYALTVPAGFSLRTYLVTPDVPACDAFRPALTLVGPGLPNDQTPAVAPERLPDPAPGDGTVTAAGDKWGTFFEPYGGVTYRTGPRLERRLEGGSYLVAVWDPTGGRGSYGLTLDGLEIPGGDPAYGTDAEAWNRCEPGLGPAATPAA